MCHKKQNLEDTPEQETYEMKRDIYFEVDSIEENSDCESEID